ncbi:MAG: hypothetical protein ACFBSD_06020 [Paracoccaceae bacterium]
MTRALASIFALAPSLAAAHPGHPGGELAHAAPFALGALVLGALVGLAIAARRP